MIIRDGYNYYPLSSGLPHSRWKYQKGAGKLLEGQVRFQRVLGQYRRPQKKSTEPRMAGKATFVKAHTRK